MYRQLCKAFSVKSNYKITWLIMKGFNLVWIHFLSNGMATNKSESIAIFRYGSSDFVRRMKYLEILQGRIEPAKF